MTDTELAVRCSDCGAFPTIVANCAPYDSDPSVVASFVAAAFTATAGKTFVVSAPAAAAVVPAWDSCAYVFPDKLSATAKANDVRRKPDALTVKRLDWFFFLTFFIIDKPIQERSSRTVCRLLDLPAKVACLFRAFFYPHRNE